MISPRKISPRARRHRHGLSFLEFIGCILSLGSGVAIGSFYLGVDMKTLFVGILERAELVDPGFFGGKAVAQQISPATDSPGAAPILASSAAGVSNGELKAAASVQHALSEQASGERIPIEEASTYVTTNADADLTDPERLAATVSYWQGLSASIAAEKQHRSSYSFDFENLQLFDYLTLRRDGHQLAVQAIEQLDERGVDDRLRWHGRQVLSWHQAGAKLFGRAVDLLTDAPTDQLIGPFAQSWQSSATQHRMEEKLVREKHLSVVSYLDHTYKDLAPFKPAF